MGWPKRICVICSQEFELKPDKPGFANRCPDCTESEMEEQASTNHVESDERRTQNEMNEERRRAIRDLLYRKDS